MNLFSQFAVSHDISPIKLAWFKTPVTNLSLCPQWFHQVRKNMLVDQCCKSLTFSCFARSFCTELVSLPAASLTKMLIAFLVDLNNIFLYNPGSIE
jgi:hypothetical protein